MREKSRPKLKTAKISKNHLINKFRLISSDALNQNQTGSDRFPEPQLKTC